MKNNAIHIELIRLIGLVFLTLLSNSLFSQQSEQAFLEAAAQKGAQEFFYKTSQVRSGGYLYVAGASINNDGNYDMLLTKYSGTTEIWSVNWDGSNGDDYAAGIAVDGSGNIIVCGTTEISSTNYNGVVAKYNSSGSLQWVSTYAGAGNLVDGFVSVAVDNSNNVYACGGTQTVSEFANYLTVKYNSSGTQQWASTYDYNNLNDGAVKLVVGGTTLRVGGGTQTSASDWQMTTVSYNLSTGVQGSVNHTGGDNEGVDTVTDLWTDGTYTYVVGSVSNISTGKDWKVIKLDANLTVVWSATYNGTANQDDQAECVKVDVSGDVYVTGWATETEEGRNFVTRKFNSSGVVQWTSAFNEESEVADDEAFTLELDASGNVIVSGSSFKDGNKDYLTLKYKYTNGAEVWCARFNSDFNDDDIPSNIALDDSGNIFVIGTVGKGDGTTTYMMCKYSEKMVFMPVPTDGFSSNGGYIQNRKQLRNDDGTANTSVKFYCQQNSPSTYIDNGKISYQFSSITEDTTDVDTLYRVDMTFTKGMGSAKVYPMDERKEYANFYLGHMPAKAERTNSYNALVKIGVYTNTDVVFTNNHSGYRHWIVARSGAPTADFEMTYTGQTSLSLNASGDLIIGTSLVDQIQPEAKVYTMDITTGALTELSWQPEYVVASNKVTFNYTGTWSGTLVIEMENQQQAIGQGVVDGNLDWSTFTGGTGFDQSLDVTSDENANVWVTGEEANEPFAATPGNITVNGAFASQGDVFIAKFNVLCQLEYFTAWGGSGFDRGWSIAHDENENVFVVGYTDSDDIINFAGGSMDDDELSGISDGLLLALSSEGNLDIDSYIGGDGIDVCTGIAYQWNNFMNQRDLWITGYGNNPSNFPTQSFGVYNQAHAGGYDVFAMRLVGEDHDLQWCSWFGSEDDDFSGDISIVTSDPVIIGVTFSDGYSQVPCGLPNDGLFPNCGLNGASWQWSWFDPGNNAAGNYFMARFSDTNLSLRWSTFMGAAPSPYIVSENKPGITTRSEGFTEESVGEIFVTGSIAALGESEFPLMDADGYFQDAFGGGGQDVFLTRFRCVGASTNLTWSTFIGGENSENGFGLAIDDSERMFLTGWMNSDDLQAEADWCAVPDDNTFPLCNQNGLNYMESDEIGPFSSRTFIMAFDTNTELKWSSQFGEGDGNKGRAVSASGDKLFLVGQSEESWTDLEFDEISSQDYYQPQLSQYRDGTIARFDIPTIVGIEEVATIENKIRIAAYPNPTFSNLTVVFGENISEAETLMIYNAIGQVVMSISLRSGVRRLDLSVNDLSPGLYQIVVKTNSKSSSCSFIKE